MVDITETAAIIAAAGVLVGVVYYILDMRNQARTRKTDLVNRLYSTFYSQEFLDASMKFMALEFKDYKDYVNKYGPIYTMSEYGAKISDRPELRAFLVIDNFFNHVGILLNRGFIDAGLVREVFTYRVEMLWRKAEPIVLGLRKELNQPEGGKWFEYLYNEMKKREQQQ